MRAYQLCLLFGITVSPATEMLWTDRAVPRRLLSERLGLSASFSVQLRIILPRQTAA